MSLYRLYGLTIESEFPLPAPMVARGTPDMTVTRGPVRPVPHDPPEGKVLSEVKLGAINYSTTRTRGGYVVRFPNLCDALVDETLSSVELVVESPEQRRFAELLFAGSTLAKILMLGGGCVLHASAVAVGDQAVAYVGPPGGGKSTLAALTCAAGGRLITDDVLRLIPRDDGWRCTTGTDQIRLRRQAAPIAVFLDGSTEETIDQRVGVSMDLIDTETRLSALVFPEPSREIPALEVTRLTEHDALMRLTAFPRVLGWKDPEVIAGSFRWNARLAREVPAFHAAIPWGPPFDPSLIHQLLDALKEPARESK